MQSTETQTRSYISVSEALDVGTRAGFRQESRGRIELLDGMERRDYVAAKRAGVQLEDPSPGGETTIGWLRPGSDLYVVCPLGRYVADHACVFHEQQKITFSATDWEEVLLWAEPLLVLRAILGANSQTTGSGASVSGFHLHAVRVRTVPVRGAVHVELGTSAVGSVGIVEAPVPVTYWAPPDGGLSVSEMATRLVRAQDLLTGFGAPWNLMLDGATRRVYISIRHSPAVKTKTVVGLGWLESTSGILVAGEEKDLAITEEEFVAAVKEACVGPTDLRHQAIREALIAE